VVVSTSPIGRERSIPRWSLAMSIIRKVRMLAKAALLLPALAFSFSQQAHIDAMSTDPIA